MADPIANCPRCRGPLYSLMEPCRTCGLAFSDTRVLCRKCKRPVGEHGRPTCPIPQSDPIPCPLCGGKRHRKMPGSIYECAWRQWENDSGGPIEHTPENEHRFLAWRDAHPNLEAGSVPAERIIRRAKRQAEMQQSVTQR